MSDFRARAGDHWARTAWQIIDVQRKSADKVHLVVQINWFDINDQLIAEYQILIIALKKNTTAVEFIKAVPEHRAAN